jgi:hypothetical protein
MVHLPGGSIRRIRREDDVMNIWFVVIIVLLGICALTLHRCDVHRNLIWIAFGRFVLGVLLLGCSGGHLGLRSQACSLHAMQATARCFDFSIAGTVTSGPLFCG